ncbi:hypothetical protein ACHAXT_002384 [Thalassiosira profunda]
MSPLLSGQPHTYPQGTPFSGSALAFMKYHSPGKIPQSLWKGVSPARGRWLTWVVDVDFPSSTLRFFAIRVDDRRGSLDGGMIADDDAEANDDSEGRLKCVKRAAEWQAGSGVQEAPVGQRRVSAAR